MCRSLCAKDVLENRVVKSCVKAHNGFATENGFKSHTLVVRNVAVCGTLFNVSGVEISWLNLIRGVESAWAVTVDLGSIWYCGCQSHDWEPNASRIWEGTLTR